MPLQTLRPFTCRLRTAGSLIPGSVHRGVCIVAGCLGGLAGAVVFPVGCSTPSRGRVSRVSLGRVRTGAGRIGSVAVARFTITWIPVHVSALFVPKTVVRSLAVPVTLSGPGIGPSLEVVHRQGADVLIQEEP
jgi:hypothetical protein